MLRPGPGFKSDPLHLWLPALEGLCGCQLLLHGVGQYCMPEVVTGTSTTAGVTQQGFVSCVQGGVREST